MILPDIQTLLAATDFSAASEPATTYAFHLARALRTRLYLMHVVPEAVCFGVRGHDSQRRPPESYHSASGGMSTRPEAYSWCSTSREGRRETYARAHGYTP